MGRGSGNNATTSILYGDTPPRDEVISVDSAEQILADAATTVFAKLSGKEYVGEQSFKNAVIQEIVALPEEPQFSLKNLIDYGREQGWVNTAGMGKVFIVEMS